MVPFEIKPDGSYKTESVKTVPSVLIVTIDGKEYTISNDCLLKAIQYADNEFKIGCANPYVNKSRYELCIATGLNPSTISTATSINAKNKRTFPTEVDYGPVLSTLFDDVLGVIKNNVSSFNKERAFNAYHTNYNLLRNFDNNTLDREKEKPYFTEEVYLIMRDMPLDIKKQVLAYSGYNSFHGGDINYKLCKDKGWRLIDGVYAYRDGKLDDLLGKNKNNNLKEETPKTYSINNIDEETYNKFLSYCNGNNELETLKLMIKSLEFIKSNGHIVLAAIS